MYKTLLSVFHFRFTLRFKLLLASSVLAIIPIIGFQYIKELELFLRQDHEQRLLENANVIAKVLASQSTLVNQLNRDTDSPNHAHLFVRELPTSILLDGFSNDWLNHESREKNYVGLPSSPNTNNALLSDPLSFGMMLGHRQHSVYAFFRIQDKHIVYRESNHSNFQDCDHVVIATNQSSDTLVNYIISSLSPGKMQARKVVKQNGKTISSSIEDRIKVVWQETSQGYNIEARIPESLLGDKIAFAVVDVDDPKQRKLKQVINTGRSNEDDLTPITIAKPALQRLLKDFTQPKIRSWLIDTNARVIAVSGSINEEPLEYDTPQTDDTSISPAQIVHGLIRIIYKLILTQPNEAFIDDVSNASQLSGSEITAALSGHANTQWRLTRDERVNILRAAQPVYSNEKLIGAVVIERNNNSILVMQNRAVEILMNTSIIVFTLSVITLIAFASRLSTRIRRLRDETDSAINSEGRILGGIANTHENDEIGDLRRSYASILTRLQEYNQYLEGMASKLSHELRTPITVVKSSLENMELSELDNTTRSYTERAKEGVDRLNNILTRMSEATRLEQTLNSEQKSIIKLEKIITGCVEGYKIANKNLLFELKIEQENQNIPGFEISGCPDLVAQLLDKLVSNAKDFADPDSPIIVRLKAQESAVQLSVQNSGPSLPISMQDNLFGSMVSVREKSGDQPHLGLGLYIVRLIAEFHSGKPFARNRNNPHGVEIGVRFPLISSQNGKQ